MIILLKLLLAHFVGDFVLQPRAWAAHKEQYKAKSSRLYLHILLHGALVIVVLWDLKYWLLALTVTFVHGAIDVLKLYVQKTDTKPRWFLIDQGMHLIALVFLWRWWFHPLIGDLLSRIAGNTVWIYVTALIFLTAVSGIVIQVVLSSWASALDVGNEESLNNAGKYIGILERLFVFTFIVTGHWEGVGFLLAAKSVFRFGDLKESKDRKLTEYILIGTLLSFGIAIAAGMLVTWLSVF